MTEGQGTGSHDCITAFFIPAFWYFALFSALKLRYFCWCNTIILDIGHQLHLLFLALTSNPPSFSCPNPVLITLTTSLPIPFTMQLQQIPLSSKHLHPLLHSLSKNAGQALGRRTLLSRKSPRRGWGRVRPS